MRGNRHPRNGNGINPYLLFSQINAALLLHPELAPEFEATARKALPPKSGTKVGKTVSKLAEQALEGGEADFYDLVIQVEVELIKKALLATGGNQAKAARMLKIKATTLNSKIKLYKIEAATGGTLQ